jgi:hypothetical protein
MIQDNVAIEIAKVNYEHLCDVETLLVLLVFCPYWNQCKGY